MSDHTNNTSQLKTDQQSKKTTQGKEALLHLIKCIQKGSDREISPANRHTVTGVLGSGNPQIVMLLVFQGTGSDWVNTC